MAEEWKKSSVGGTTEKRQRDGEAEVEQQWSRGGVVPTLQWNRDGSVVRVWWSSGGPVTFTY